MEFTDFRDSNLHRQTAMVNQELDELIKLERTGRLPIEQPKVAPAAPAKTAPKADDGMSIGEGVAWIGKEVVKTTVGSARNLGQSAIDLIYDATNLASDNLFDYHFQTPKLPEVAKPESLGGKITQPLLQFAVPYTRVLNTLKPLAASKTAKAAAAGAVADFSAFDPHESNLSNMLLNFTKENPSVASPIIEYLAIDKDDGNFEARAKRALEGLGVGAAIDTTMAGLKATKAYFNSKGMNAAEAVQEASKANLEAAFKPGNGLSVQEQIEHVTGVKAKAVKPEARQADLETAFKDDADVADHFARQVKSKETQAQRERHQAGDREVPALREVSPTEKVHLYEGKLLVAEPKDTPKGSLDLDTKVKAALEKNPVERDASDLIALRAHKMLQESLFQDIIQPVVSTGGSKITPELRKEITSGLVLPKQSTKAMTDAERTALRKEMDDLTKQIKANNDKIKAATEAAASTVKKGKRVQPQVLDLSKPTAKPKVSPGGIQLSTNPFFDPAQLMELARTTGRLSKFLVQSPGDAASGAAGAAAGYSSAEEDASTEDKLMLALGGFLGGVAIHRGVKGKAPVQLKTAPEISPIAHDLARPSVSGISPVVPLKAPVKLPGAKIDGIMQALQTGKSRDLAEALDTEDFNFTRIDTPEEAKELIDAFSNTFAKEVSKAKGGTQTFGDIKALAEELGAGEKSLKALYGDTDNLAARVTSHRVLLAASAKKVSELARDARLGGDSDVLAFRKQVVLHATIQAEMKGVQTEIARALASFRIKAKSEALVVNEVNELVQALGGRELNKEMAAKFAQATDAKQLHAMARKGALARTQNAFFEMWVNGILSGPATHAVNAIGNGLVAINSVLERSVAGVVGHLRGNEDAITQEEVTSHLFGMMEGLLDTVKITANGQRALSQAAGALAKGDLKNAKGILKENENEFGTTYQAFAKDAPILDNAMYGTKEFDMQRKAISSEALGLDPEDWKGIFADALGTTIRTPGRFLTSSDELFKTIHYRGELKAQAYRQARREGLSGEALAKRVADLVEEEPEHLTSIAMDAARRGTFTSPLGTVGRGFQNAVSQTPGARYIMPFVRTPANIMNYVWERTPVLNAVNGRMRDDYLAGGVRRDMAIAKTAIGGSMYMLGGYLASQGIITGGGEKNQTAERLGGKQPYSVKVGDTYYAYNRMDPYGMFLGLAADFSHITGMLSEGEREDWVAASITALSKNLLSKSYLSGLVDLIDAITTSEQSSKPFERWLQRFGSSFVPFSSLQGAVRREVDPEVKEIWTYADAVKARIPGFSDSVPPMRNIFGDVVHYSGGLGPDIASPVYSSTETDNPAAAEISRLNLDLQKPMKFIGGRGVPRIDLNQEQYDRLVQLAGNEAKIFDGLGFKDYLTQWVQSPEYQELSEGGQDFEGSKQTEIRFVYQLAKQAASAQLMEEYPELKRQYEKNMLNRGAALTGEAFGQM